MPSAHAQIQFLTDVLFEIPSQLADPHAAGTPRLLWRSLQCRDHELNKCCSVFFAR